MANTYNATTEHVPFGKDKEKKKENTESKGRHPNKNRKDKHPVSGK